MELPVFILLLVALSALFAATMYLVYTKLNEETKQNMSELADHYTKIAKNQTPTTELPYCPKGCERGDCKDRYACYDFYNPNAKCCKFDLQCRNCVDKKTGNVYYNEGGDTDFIDNNYKSTDPKTIKELNHEIRRQNNYIQDLNQLVSEHNKPFFDQQQTENESA